MNNEEKELLATIAYVYLHNNKLDEARVLYKALNVLFPADLQIGVSLSYTLLLSGEYAEALYEVEGCLPMAGTKEEKFLISLIKSRALWGLNEESAAIEEMREAEKARNR